MPLKPPIFVVGCGHSGTSLTLALLGAHSRIYAVLDESRVFMRKSERLRDQLLANFESLAREAGKVRWAEKTPLHVHHLDKIFACAPQARVLMIIRDGRDVACSIRDRTGSLEKGVERWLADNEAGRPFWAHPNVHVFRYENLVRDPEATLRRIAAFIGEDYEDGMLAYHRQPIHFYSQTIEKPPTPFGDNHRQHRNWQINQPLFDGRGRWRDMPAEDLRYILERAGSLLSELGYIE